MNTNQENFPNEIQAQKFKNLEDNDSDDELGEESLLDTPLDKVEPYQLFKNALLSKTYPCCSVFRWLTASRTPTRAAATLRVPDHNPQPRRAEHCSGSGAPSRCHRSGRRDGGPGSCRHKRRVSGREKSRKCSGIWWFTRAVLLACMSAGVFKVKSDLDLFRGLL
jgi:hypothetical protein